MSDYEMYLLAGSSTVIFGVLLLFSAGAHDKPLLKSMAFFVLGAGLLYMADRASSSGIVFGDIPAAAIKLTTLFM